MNLIGRYDQIRRWDLPKDTLSAPYHLDRGRAQWDAKITPVLKHPEWQEKREREWSYRSFLKNLLKDQKGIIGFETYSAVPMLWFGMYSGTQAFNGTALNAAYVAGSGGPAAGVRWFSPVTKTVSFIYFYAAQYQGVNTVPNDIDCELRTDNSVSGNFKPTTASSLATGTVDPLHVLGWTKGPTFNTSISAMTFYWSVVGDADGDGTNYLWINGWSSLAMAYPFEPANIGAHCAFTTTAGWTTITQRGCGGRIITCFSDGTAVGDPFTNTATITASTNDKGLFLNGLTAPLVIVGMGGDVNDTHIAAFNIYASGTSQGGATLASGTILGNVAATGSKNALMLSAPYTLAANTPCRMVFTSDGQNTTSPRQQQIGTIGTGGSATDLQGAFPLQGASYYTNWNGSAWVDTLTAFPIIYVWIQDQVAAPAGGGPFSRILTGQ